MNIEDFKKKYKNSSNKKNVNSLIQKWIATKQVNDFLGTEIMAGVMMADIIQDGSIIDYIDRNTYLGFKALMGEKADSIEEIRELLIEKYEKGFNSTEGLLNKIQGQVGENIFVNEAGAFASLAESGSQEGWDVKINHLGHDQFIQVKVYENADQVMEKIREVNEKIANHKIEGVSHIDFAVNSDIHQEVLNKVKLEGLSNKILDIGATRDEIRGSLSENFGLLSSTSPLENFFGELFHGMAFTGSIHALTNAFLVYKGAKEKGRAIEDTIFSTGISAVGYMASLGTSTVTTSMASAVNLKLAGILLGPVGTAASFGAGLITRSILKRIIKRRDTLESLKRDLNRNLKIINRLNPR